MVFKNFKKNLPILSWNGIYPMTSFEQQINISNYVALTAV